MSNEAEDYAAWMGEGRYDEPRRDMDDELPAGVTAVQGGTVYLTAHLAIAWTERPGYRAGWWGIYHRYPGATTEFGGYGLESSRHASFDFAIRNALALEAEHDILELHQDACYPPHGATVDDVAAFLSTSPWPPRRKRVHGYDLVPIGHYWMRILEDGTLARWRENFDSSD